MRDAEAEVHSQKGDDLAANLQLGHIGIQQQPVGTVDFNTTWPSSTSLMFVGVVVST